MLLLLVLHLTDEKTEVHRSWIACPCHRARFGEGFELSLYKPMTHSPNYYTIRLLLQTKQSGVLREYMWTSPLGTQACEEYRTREKVRAQELAQSASTGKMNNSEGAWEPHPAQLMGAPEMGTLPFISALQCLTQNLSQHTSAQWTSWTWTARPDWMLLARQKSTSPCIGDNSGAKVASCVCEEQESDSWVHPA